MTDTDRIALLERNLARAKALSDEYKETISRLGGEAAGLITENEQHKAIVAKVTHERDRLAWRLRLSQRREVKLCGDHHGKSYNDGKCILCNFEKRRGVAKTERALEKATHTANEWQRDFGTLAKEKDDLQFKLQGFEHTAGARWDKLRKAEKGNETKRATINNMDAHITTLTTERDAAREVLGAALKDHRERLPKCPTNCWCVDAAVLAAPTTEQAS